MTTQNVSGAVRIDTTTYPLFVPDEVMCNSDPEHLFHYLVTAWVFTAWLSKRFPDADVMDCSMLGGMAAWKPADTLIPLMKESNKRYPKHPKVRQNVGMLRCIDDDFGSNTSKLVTHEMIEELTTLNKQACVEASHVIEMFGIMLMNLN